MLVQRHRNSGRASYFDHAALCLNLAQLRGMEHLINCVLLSDTVRDIGKVCHILKLAVKIVLPRTACTPSVLVCICSRVSLCWLHCAVCSELFIRTAALEMCRKIVAGDVYTPSKSFVSKLRGALDSGYMCVVYSKLKKLEEHGMVVYPMIDSSPQGGRNNELGTSTIVSKLQLVALWTSMLEMCERLVARHRTDVCVCVSRLSYMA